MHACVVRPTDVVDVERSALWHSLVAVPQDSPGVATAAGAGVNRSRWPAGRTHGRTLMLVCTCRLREIYSRHRQRTAAVIVTGAAAKLRRRRRLQAATTRNDKRCYGMRADTLPACWSAYAGARPTENQQPYCLWAQIEALHWMADKLGRHFLRFYLGFVGR